MSLLPTAPSVPQQDPALYRTLIYGHAGVGKTTLCAQFPDAVFLSCEPGALALQCYLVETRTWERLVAAVEELARGGHRFRTVVVDTIDAAWIACHSSVLASMGRSVEPDDYGRTHSKIMAEFRRAVLRLTALQMGVVLVSHARVERRKDRMDREYEVTTTTLPGKTAEWVHGLVDFVLYYEHSPELDKTGRPTGETVRRLRSRAGATWFAKDRTGRMTDPLALPPLPPADPLEAARATYQLIDVDMRRALAECHSAATMPPAPAAVQAAAPEAVPADAPALPAEPTQEPSMQAPPAAQVAAPAPRTRRR